MGSVSLRERSGFDCSMYRAKDIATSLATENSLQNYLNRVLKVSYFVWVPKIRMQSRNVIERSPIEKLCSLFWFDRHQ